MFKNGFKIAWRSLLKDRQFSILNLIGLATGLACSLLIYLWVRDERSVDHFNEKDSRTYEVLKNVHNEDGTTTMYETTQGLLGESLVGEVPGVEYAAAVRNGGTGIVSGTAVASATGTNGATSSVPAVSAIDAAGLPGTPVRARMRLTGKDFFNIFSYGILEGDKNTVLSEPTGAMVSDKLAKTLFNNTTGIVGKRIEWKGQDFYNGSYVITGVFKAPPSNASDQFDLCLSYSLYKEKEANEVTNWESNGVVTYLLLKNGVDAKQFGDRIKNFTKTKTQGDGDLFVQKYSDKYLYGKYDNGVAIGGRIEYVRLFSIIAIFILVIACINFMNLSTARASGRMKEVGIRKVVGARRGSLVLQYMGESILMAFLSLLVSILLVWLLLPAFRGITGKELPLHLDLGLFFSIGLIALVTGLIAGSYPALYLSGFKPVAVLKGKLTASAGENWIRKGLVVFQFTVSVVLILTVLVVYRQMNLIQTTNLGYSKAHILHFSNEGRLATNEEAFLTEVRALPGVVSASSMDGDMTGGYSQGGGLIDWKGKTPNQHIEFEGLDMDYGMPEMLGMQMKEGRPFSRANGLADTSSVIFNESAIAAMGLKDPIGQFVTVWRHKMQIVGVVKDFHFESMYKKIMPFFFRCVPNNGNIYVKIGAGMTQETMARLEKTYRQFNQGLAFEYRFLDDDYQALYESELRVSVLSRYFAVIAILISCLGLFGLTAFTAQKRQKEIGIRKVVGASSADVVLLLSKDFLRLVFLAILIAFPIGWWSMSEWLKSFVYRIELGPIVFVIAGLSILLITLITVSFQSIRAAMANPVKSLRSE